MTKFVFAAVAAIALAAPAAAQDAAVEIYVGDLDIATATGAVTLAQRVSTACERPDMRNVKAMGQWERCKDAALKQAAEQLTGKGAILASLG